MDCWKLIRRVEILEHSGQSGIFVTGNDFVTCTLCRVRMPFRALLDHVIGSPFSSPYFLSHHRTLAWSPRSTQAGLHVGTSRMDTDISKYIDPNFALQRLREQNIINSIHFTSASPFHVLESRDKIYCSVCDSVFVYQPSSLRADVRRHCSRAPHMKALRAADPVSAAVPMVDSDSRITEKLVRNLRRRVDPKVSKILSDQELFGCSPLELKQRLQDKFKPGMAWPMYGSFHVDHRVPVCQFDMTDPLEAMICSHHSNLQPLWGHENLAKGSRNECHPDFSSV